MGIYLWHQPVLVAVTALTAHLGRALPGLHTAPAGPGWVAARICWLPLFALVLAVLVASRRNPSGRRPGPLAPGSPAGPAVGTVGIGSPDRAGPGWPTGGAGQPIGRMRGGGARVYGVSCLAGRSTPAFGAPPTAGGDRCAR